MNHHKLISLLVAGLMVSGVLPFLWSPVVTAAPQIDGFTPSDFAWTTFNKNMNVTTFVSPDGSKDELFHILNSAEESIYVEIYGINNPYILELFHELHDTKPSLDVKFLLGWNSLGYTSVNDYVANNLTILGYPVKWTSDPDFRYAHQKFLIIDNKTTVVHAGNWAKTSFPEDGNKANREWSIAMTDTEVTGYYRSVFDYDWSRGTDYDAGTHGTGEALTYSATSSTYTRPFATPGEFSGPMNVTPILSPETSLQGILHCINIAQATLDIQIPYFTNVGDDGEVDEIIDAILAAKARGVTVRIITDEEKDFELLAEIMHEHDIPVVWQDTRWTTANHNKGIIVDGRIVLISSINYSENSITLNREAGVIIENEDVAQWFQSVYDFDWAMGDNDVMDEVNLYWTPNIPTSSSAITVTVYAHSIYSDVDAVQLDVKIGNSAWNNVSITANVGESAEGQLENYEYTIPAQSDGTNITVVGRISNGTHWFIGLPMVIRVRDSIGSAATTPPPPSTDPLAEFMEAYGAYVIIGAIAALCGGTGYVANKKGYVSGPKKRSTRRKSRKKK